MKSTGPAGPLARWLPVVLWAAVISLLSSDAFSGDNTGGMMLPLLRTLLPAASADDLLAAHAVLRKLAHVTEYAILAMLVFRALDDPGRTLGWLVVVALLCCAGYAALDELHQAFVPSRTASPLDVALDASGAALGLALRVSLGAALSAGRRSPA